MARSIAQRLAALEKAVAEFIGVRPRKKAKKAAGARKRTKKAKAKSASGARKTARKKKSGRRRTATALPLPPG